MRYKKSEPACHKSPWGVIIAAVLLAIFMVVGAKDLAAQSPEGFPQPGNGFPPIPTFNAIPSDFLGTWRFDNSRPDLRGNCGSLEKRFPERRGCESPIDKLEPLMNGRMHAWINAFYPDETLSPKWGCVAGGLQTQLADGYIWEFTANPDVLLQKWEQSNWTRQIWMDGRHPPFMQSFYHGHSIGRVVSPTEFMVHTANFTFDPDGWGDATLLPTSHAKQLTERYMLVDFDTLMIEFTVVDPVFINAPFTWRKQYKRTEQRFLNRWDCDPETNLPELYSDPNPKYQDDAEWLKYNPR